MISVDSSLPDNESGEARAASRRTCSAGSAGLQTFQERLVQPNQSVTFRQIVEREPKS